MYVHSWIPYEIKFHFDVMIFYSVIYLVAIVELLQICHCYVSNVPCIRITAFLDRNNHQNVARFLSQQSTDFDEKIIHGGFNHCGILVADNERSKTFFIEVLDFIDESHLRPKTLPFPGSFLRFGNHQIHLMQCHNVDPTEGRPEYGGRDRHLALTVNNVDIIKRRLERAGVTYNLSSSGRRSLFCRDFDGNGFEFVEDTSLNNK